MKKRMFLTALLLLAALCSGCGSLAPELPADATAFPCVEFVDPADPEDGYLALEYGGRTYLPYGTLGGRLRKSDLGPCLGYPVQEGEAQRDVRICLLAADPAANYLVELFPEAVMQQPVFYRALDTAGREINTPDWITPLEYGIWWNGPAGQGK